MPFHKYFPPKHTLLHNPHLSMKFDKLAEAKASQQLCWTIYGGHFLLSFYFILRSYLNQLSHQSSEEFTNIYSSANQDLIINILISSIVTFFITMVLRSHITHVIDIMRAKEEAEQKAAVKAKFLSTMSHEIRTPMNAVIGLSNILMEESPREDQKENIETLKFSADLLLSLINDILDYSKIDAGKIEIEKTPFELHSLVNNIRKTLDPNAKLKGLDLNLHYDKNLPSQVIGDPVRLSQILTNLIGNAIKFTSKGKVDIELDLIQQVDQTIAIQIGVRDSGIGIAKDKFETIFQSFSQADTATTRKYGGTGLGLSITTKLLELQNSKIQLESEVNVGSRFFFDLEFGVAEVSIKNTIQKSEPIDTPIEDFDGAKVLLVEDNKINVMVAQKFLKKWGLEVDVAENGKIALEKVQQNDYELVLMDLDMPIMDGYEATKQIRALKEKRYQELPIIALSASAVMDFRSRAMEVGMVEYVTKPFKPMELQQVLFQYIKIPA